MGPLTCGFFFNSKYDSTTQSSVVYMHGCGTTDAEELHIWRADYKLYTDF